MSRFRPPVRSKGDGYVIDIGRDEAALVQRLIGELRALLTTSDPEPGSDAQALLIRLFPVAYPDDDELEVEYQRLMRGELVQSKLAAMTIVDDALASDGRVDEGRLMAFMQSLNSLRLVLGTMLGIADDDTQHDDAADDHVAEGLEDSPEFHLYSYLSWLLEWSVRALG